MAARVKTVVGVPRSKATVRRRACCMSDEGRPLGFADQAVIPNHPELQPLRAVVVSVSGKGGMKPVRYAGRRRTQVNHRGSVENCNDVKTGDSTTPPGSARRRPEGGIAQRIEEAHAAGTRLAPACELAGIWRSSRAIIRPRPRGRSPRVFLTAPKALPPPLEPCPCAAALLRAA